MAIQRDNDPIPDFSNAALPRADSGYDLPRWLVILGAAAGFTLFVALLRYAIDLLGVVFLIIMVGFAIRTLSDWLTEGEAVSAWTMSALSLGLTGTVLVGLWLFNSGDASASRLGDNLPGPLQKTVAWFENHGWGQRVLLPAASSAASAGAGARPFAGAGAGTTGGDAAGGSERAAVSMTPPRAAPPSSAAAATRPRRSSRRAAPPGEATASPHGAAPVTQRAPSAPSVPPPAARAETFVTLSAPASSIVGRAVRLTAVVSAAGGGERVPSGQVVFSSGQTIFGRAPVQRGTALLVSLSLDLGEHQLSAAYQGDKWHLPSESAPVGHTVRRH